MAVTIKKLQKGDLADVTTIHLKAFPESALTQLGAGAVQRYYDWLLTGPHDAEIYGVFQDETMLGYCFCGKFRGALSGFVKKNKLYLSAQVILRPWLLLTGEFQKRIKSGLKALFRKQAPASEKTDAVSIVASFGILAIAVAPNCQGTGAGKKLMEEADRRARQKKYQKMNLSVATTNKQAISFYERLGWQKVLEDEIWQGQMTKELTT